MAKRGGDGDDDTAPMICPATGGYCDNLGDPSCDELGCVIRLGGEPLGPDNLPMDDDL
jgi:hypothetical protein